MNDNLFVMLLNSVVQGVSESLTSESNDSNSFVQSHWVLKPVWPAVSLIIFIMDAFCAFFSTNK